MHPAPSSTACPTPRARGGTACARAPDRSTPWGPKRWAACARMLPAPLPIAPASHTTTLAPFASIVSPSPPLSHRAHAYTRTHTHRHTTQTHVAATHTHLNDFAVIPVVLLGILKNADSRLGLLELVVDADQRLDARRGRLDELHFLVVQRLCISARTRKNAVPEAAHCVSIRGTHAWHFSDRRPRTLMSTGSACAAAHQTHARGAVRHASPTFSSCSMNSARLSRVCAGRRA